MKLGRLDLAAIGVVAGQGLLAAYVYGFGKTGRLPMHFGLNGQVDRWGDRTELAAVIAAMAGLTALTYAALPILSRARATSVGEVGQTYARASLLAGPTLASLLLAALGTGVVGTAGEGLHLSNLMMAFLAVIAIVLGALVGKTAPNPFVGMRTFWALRSRLAWDRSNRLLGRLWFWLGLLALFSAPLAPQPAGTTTLIAAMLLSAVVAGVESWRVWREDPDRAPI
jgi:uncharacterized membrane protein